MNLRFGLFTDCFFDFEIRIKTAKAKFAFVLFATVLFLSPVSLSASESFQLQTLKRRLQRDSREAKKAAIDYARAKKLPLRGKIDGTGVFELDRLLAGMPIYKMTDNYVAARTISTDKVWPGGEAGLSLDGSGMFLGIWDAGGVYTGHREFNGRIHQIDHPLTVEQHSTAIAGTMIASGVHPDAKGMAPAAVLHAYEWNDELAEMAAAAENGMLVSNHSYSSIAGWVWGDWGKGQGWYWWGDVTISEVESFFFGWYSIVSQFYDELAYAAPEYLSVWSAGNDRQQGPEPGVYHWAWSSAVGDWIYTDTVRPKDGDYDCIVGAALAKNVLTVGAVEDIQNGYNGPAGVVMTPYSSWGPVDDGRIKPDLMTNGASLFTTGSSAPASYIIGNGTSYSAPGASGSLILLQQHYHDLFQVHMRSSTLKALVIHTSDESGAFPGPDYAFGWGLLNTRKAADLISRNRIDPMFIQEIVLDENQYIGLTYYSDGIEPIRATIAWLDPPGDPVYPVVDDSTPMLVNDLDLRLFNIAGTEVHEPWILDLVNPQNPATTGDNQVDNIEQVFVENPSPGFYQVVIDHKGNLQNGQQNVSVILTGLEEACALQARLFLEGPYLADETMASGALNVPIISPYPQARDTVLSIPSNVVDWVLLEIYNDPAEAPVYRRSVWLRNDGYLIDPITSSQTVTVKIPSDMYYVAIRHRNHLGCSSAHAIRLSVIPEFYDFTTGENRYFDRRGIRELEVGKWGLAAGDGNHSQGVYAEDYRLVKIDWQSVGYLAADYNMDGLVDDTDMTIYLHNQGLESGFPP